MLRIEREPERRKIVGVVEISRELAKWRRLQRKNLDKLGLSKRKECRSCQLDNFQ